MAIQAELQVPDTVTIPAGGGSVKIEVLCRLHNIGEDAHVVGSAGPDDIHNWHVLSESHREVLASPRGASKKGRAGKLPHVSQLIGAGHTHNAPQTLTLDAKKLRPGQRYTVRYEFHGHIAEAAFTTVAGHVAPARRKSAKKTTAKKPAARKAATKRKPAAKKK